MYDVGGKLLEGIRNMYVNTLACIRARGVQSREGVCRSDLHPKADR